MATTSVATAQQSSFTNQMLHGDCIDMMRQMPSNSVDFILTDPPYLVNYRDRSGRTVQNDANAEWLMPAMAEAYRVLKQNRVAIMFYGWTKVDAFFEAWRSAGFQPVGNVPSDRYMSTVGVAMSTMIKSPAGDTPKSVMPWICLGDLRGNDVAGPIR